MIYRKNIDVAARDTFLITDIQASTIADKIIGIVPVKCELVSAKATYGTAAGQTCTGAVERLRGTETSAAGDQCATGFNFESAVDTVQTATIVTASDIHIFEAGDRVGVNTTGTTTTLATLIVACQFRPVD